MRRSMLVRAQNPRFKSGWHQTAGLIAIAIGSLVSCSDSQMPAAPSNPAPAPLEPTPVLAAAGSPVQINAGAAAMLCPATTLGATNLAVNPSFESGKGPQTFPPGSSTKPSAATGWNMHTSNSLAPVTTTRVSLPFAGVPNPPGPPAAVGSRMLRITSGSVEGGVFQQIAAPAKVMFSIWVYVKRGRAFLELNSLGNPGAWTTKRNEWEQIRVCSDGSNFSGYFGIFNQDPNGGDFFIDRAEIRQIF